MGYRFFFSVFVGYRFLFLPCGGFNYWLFLFTSSLYRARNLQDNQKTNYLGVICLFLLISFVFVFLSSGYLFCLLPCEGLFFNYWLFLFTSSLYRARNLQNNQRINCFGVICLYSLIICAAVVLLRSSEDHFADHTPSSRTALLPILLHIMCENSRNPGPSLVRNEPVSQSSPQRRNLPGGAPERSRGLWMIRSPFGWQKVSPFIRSGLKRFFLYTSALELEINSTFVRANSFTHHHSPPCHHGSMIVILLSFRICFL